MNYKNYTGPREKKKKEKKKERHVMVLMLDCK